MKVCPDCGGTYPVAEGFCPMDGARLQVPDDAPWARPEVDPETWVGRILDRRYRLDEVIGTGGMGFVFRATHTLIGKSIAIKALRPEHVCDPDVVKRFLQEARLSSSIKHPNVVDLSDFGETPGGGAYYAMEFLRGRTLAKRIDDDGPLAPEEALAVALQISRGLGAAHAQGIVHRDLKPDNVFLSDKRFGEVESVVKLLDFGIARAGESNITIAGAVLGTPEYMSPEQARGEKVDHRADLYALGVILFEMLTGLVPFQSEDVANVIFAHLNSPPPSMCGLLPSVAHLKRTDQAIRGLLSKSASDRPSSAEEAVQLLTKAVEFDLGHDAADRVQRATLAIGSGGVGDGASAALGAGGWSGRTGKTEVDTAPVMLTGPNTGPSEIAPPTEPGAAIEGDEEPEARRRSIPLLMGGAAICAALATGALYLAIGPGDGPDLPQGTHETTPAQGHDNATPAAVTHPTTPPEARMGGAPTVSTSGEKPPPYAPPAPAEGAALVDSIEPPERLPEQGPGKQAKPKSATKRGAPKKSPAKTPNTEPTSKPQATPRHKPKIQRPKKATAEKTPRPKSPGDLRDPFPDSGP